jgi:ribosomal protein L37AE/L43A
MTERADWSCPSCNSSDVFRDGKSRFECRDCGEQVHEAVIDASESLQRLAKRDDKVGQIAQRLLDTGGVAP